MERSVSAVESNIVENFAPFTMASQFTRVLRLMKREVWHFPVASGESHFADNGSTYFEEHAAEKAATLGYDVVAMKNIRIDGSRVSGWMISGTIVLQNPAAAAPESHALQAQMG